MLPISLAPPFPKLNPLTCFQSARKCKNVENPTVHHVSDAGRKWEKYYVHVEYVIKFKIR